MKTFINAIRIAVVMLLFVSLTSLVTDVAQKNVHLKCAPKCHAGLQITTRAGKNP